MVLMIGSLKLNTGDYPSRLTESNRVKAIYRTHDLMISCFRKKDGARLAASTQRQWLTAVKGLCTWLVRQGAIDRSPAAELAMPLTEHRLPRLC